MFGKNRMRIGKAIGVMEFQKVFVGDMPRWRFRRSLLGRDFCFELEGKMNPHIVIVGESGSGKSNLCRLVVRSLADSGVCFALLDPHNEYVENAGSFNATAYNAAHNGVNIFDLDGMSAREKAGELLGIFRKTFRLGEVQGNLLYKCMEYMYRIGEVRQTRPNIHNLLYAIKVFQKHAGRAEVNVLDSLEKRMALLSSEPFVRSINISRIMTSNSIFALSSLHTNEAQHVYIEGLLRKIYANMLNMDKSGKPRFYIVVDEAEKLDDESIIARIVAEGRKYGVGVMAIAQRAKAINKEVRSNSSLFIAFSQREPDELNYVANFISGGNEGSRFIEVKKALRNLGRGRAVVLDFREREPRLVRFDLFSEERRDPAYHIVDMTRGAAPRAELLGKLEGMGFDIHSIDWNVTRLLGSGSLQQYEMAGGPYKGTWYMSNVRNSVEHDVMVNVIHRHLKSIGISSFVYNNAYGPDVVAFVEGRRVAIEYETGRNAIDRTRYMLGSRRERYGEVVVVANDKAYGTYTSIEGIRLMRANEFFGLFPK